MSFCGACCERTSAWMLSNKIIVILSLLSFSLFISTLAIAGQRNRLSTELEECKTHTTPAPPTTTTVSPTTTTAAPPSSETASFNEKAEIGSNRDSEKGNYAIASETGEKQDADNVYDSGIKGANSLSSPGDYRDANNGLFRRKR